MAAKEGYDPNLLDTPKLIISDQPGLTDSELKNDKYEKGLQ